MRLVSTLFLAGVMLMIILSSTISLAAENNQAKLSTNDQKIQKLQKQVNILSNQLAIVIKNQQGIAKKIGVNTPKKQPVITVDNSASLGSVEAKIALVEFTDLHCPFCKKFHNKIYPELKKQYIDTGKLRFIGKHFPIVQLHKNAAVAAFALECAREDGDYKKAKDWLFERGKNFSKTHLDDFTRAMNLDKEKFAACVASPETAAQINKDMNIARAIGVNQTPSFAIGLQKNGQVIDWKIITGAQSVENFGKAIAQFTELAKTKG